MSQSLTNLKGEVRSRAKKRKRPLVTVPETDGENDEIKLGDSLASYDAIAVYFSFAFHLTALAVILLVLWMLDLIYLPTYESVDPLRAALADETVMDDEALMETEPLQIQTATTVEVPEDSAVSIAKSISEEALNSADVLDAVTGSQGDQGTPGLNVWLPKGGNAVTQGSFTAWTVPENPGQGEAYQIVIEIKLPERIKIYRLTDLKGLVVGTDGYRQQLPWDSDTRPPWPYPYRLVDGRAQAVKWRDRKDRIRVRGKLQMYFKVPGAKDMVKDQITLRSEVLKEEQELELVFGLKKRGARRGN